MNGLSILRQTVVDYEQERLESRLSARTRVRKIESEALQGRPLEMKLNHVKNTSDDTFPELLKSPWPDFSVTVSEIV